MKFVILLILYSLLTNLIVFGQPYDKEIDIKNVDCKLIEYFTKTYIDSVRSAHGLNSLTNDKILYKAAIDHAAYLLKLPEISHYQNSSLKHAPSNRITFYGGNYPMTGENVIRSYINMLVIDSHTKEKSFNHTYIQVARDLVKGWVNSPGHFANIITPGFNLTGLALTFNSKNNSITGVQVFGKAHQFYMISLDNSLFPYDTNNINKPLNTISIETHKKHAYNIKNCVDPKTLASYRNYETRYRKAFSLYTYNNKIIVTMGYYSDARNFFRKPKDGLLVEYIPYDYYYCDSTLRTFRPNRNNRQCIFSGKLLKPVYKRKGKLFAQTESLRGINPKNKKKLFNVNLGEATIISNSAELNLIVLKKNKIVDIIPTVPKNFSPWNFSANAEFPIVTANQKNTYNPIIKNDTLKLKYFYKVKQINPSDSLLAKIEKILTDSTIIIQKVIINSFTSIEGNDSINYRLINERAQYLSKLFKPTIGDNKIFISSKLNYGLIKDQYLRTRFFPFLDKNDSMWIKRITMPDTISFFQNLFDSQRFVTLTIITTKKPTTELLCKEAIKNYSQIFSKSRENRRRDYNYLMPSKTLNKIQNIQYYIFTNCKSCSNEFIENMPVIVDDRNKQKPNADQGWYLYRNKQLFLIQQYFLEGKNELIFQKLNSLIKTKDSSIVYNFYAFIANQITEKNREDYYTHYLDYKILKIAIDYAEKYCTYESYRSFTYFMHSMYIHANIAVSFFDNSIFNESLKYIFSYLRDEKFPEEHLIKMAYNYLYFNSDIRAEALIRPFLKNYTEHKEAYTCWLKMNYKLPEPMYPDYDYSELMEAAQILTPNEWINLFKGQFHINMQYLDYEPLQQLYCKMLEKSQKIQN